MKILLVEDDDFKSSAIMKLAEELVDNLDFIVKTNVYDAQGYLYRRTQDLPDKIILDMSLPMHSPKVGEGDPLSMLVGGLEVLFLIKSEGLIEIPLVILTQYPDIEIEGEYVPIVEAAQRIEDVYEIPNVSVVNYINDEVSSDAKWKVELERFLKV